MDYEHFLSGDLHSRLSSPTCEDLGIPTDLPPDFRRYGRMDPALLQGGALSITVQGLKYDPDNPNNPFSPYCQIPLPAPFSPFECGFEPAFIRKRNERERERVRCVNDGYAKLRDHLPLENKEKRVSKVETLRGAIRYIKHLQTLLTDMDKKQSDKRRADDDKDGKASPKKLKADRKSAKRTEDD